MKKYEIEYWFMSYPLESYDYDTVIVEASNSKEAILKAKDGAPRYAKNFKVIENK